MTVCPTARGERGGKDGASARSGRGAAKRGLALIAALLVAAGGARAEPAVAVSLKPVHSLVETIMRGVGAPILLVPDGSLPDGYPTPPAARAALRAADVIVWLGQPADAGLAAAIAGRKASANLVTLAAAPGVATAPLPIEAHAWLDPRNAVAMAAAIAAALSEADPANTGAYRNNAAGLRAALETLDADLRRDLARLGATPFLLYEDAFGLFARRYGLAGARPVVIDPALRRHLGGIDIGRLRPLRAEWRKAGIHCLLHEPTAERDFVRLLVDETEITAVPLDPYGTGLAAGADLYAALLRRIGDTILRCLAAAP